MSKKTSFPEPPVRTAPSERLRLVFVVLLMAVLWLRPLISESGQRGPTPLDTQPATVWSASNSVVLDLTLLFMIVCLQFWSSTTGRRSAPDRVGFALLFCAAIVSSIFAKDPRSAVNFSSNLLILVLAGWALGQAIHSRQMVCILLAGVLASGAVNAAKCVLQGSGELADTFAYWQTHEKPQRIAAGADPESPEIVNIERRMRSLNAFGYQFHPNVAASLMVAAAVVAMGVLIACVRVRAFSTVERFTWIGGILGYLILCAVAIQYTGSNGAIVAGILGFCTMVALRLAHPMLRSHPRRIWSILITAYAALAGTIAGYGIARGTLPGASMAFRWEYWTTAMRVYADTPWSGTGGHNFAAGYLLHKSPAATEDVDNPHSIWVSLLVELGPLGLIAGITLSASALWKTFAGYRSTEKIASDVRPVKRWIWIVAVAAFSGLHILWTDLPLSSPGVAEVWAVEVLIVWTVTFWASAALLIRLTAESAGVAVVIVTLTGAMAMLLIHGMVDFALLTPAGLAVFAALTAAAIGMSNIEGAPRTLTFGRRAVGTFVIGGLALAAHATVVVLPTINTAQLVRQILQRAPAAAQQSDARLLALNIEQVAHADRLDPAPPTFLADAQLQVSKAVRTRAPQQADQFLKLAQQSATLSDRRYPNRFATRRVQAEIEDELERNSSGMEMSSVSAANAWDAAVALNPTNPRLHIRAAQAWMRRPGDTNASKMARAHLERALAIDRLRSTDSPIRLQPRELEEVENDLRSLQG